MIACVRFMILACLLSALSACSLFPGKQKAITVYAPQLTLPTSVADHSVDWQLMVNLPAAINPLDGTRIVVMPQPGVIEFYKGARWRERVPVMLQSMLVQAFQDSGRIIGVNTPNSGIAADYGLLLQLRDFQSEYRGEKTPTVIIRIDAQLLHYSSNRIIAAHSFTVAQHSSGTTVALVAASFEQGLNQLVPQLLEWTVEMGDRHRQLQP